MFVKKTNLFLISITFTVAILASCSESPEPVEVTRIVNSEVTRVVTETIIEEGGPIGEATRGITETVVTEVGLPPVVEELPVTFDGYSTIDIPTLDPQLAQDLVSITYIENLFVGLTNYDLETSEVVPEAATRWEISEDGLQYTFYLRTDIPWVYHNPVTAETTQEVDEAGNLRFVTAHDFAYGISRACDPNLGSYYSSVIAPLIVGCSNVLNIENTDDITAELWAGIGVTAVDDAILTIKLNFPASYFLSMTPMWTLAATPEWAIEEHGSEWIEAGNIVTNGRFVLSEWVHNVRRTVLRNPLMPDDMRGTGNIEKHVVKVVPDIGTGYALWQTDEVDISALPDDEVQTHLEQFPEQTIRIPDLSVFYVSFRMTKPPFDDVHVRRAFSAAIDRETYVNNILQGQGLPMKHFAPPGIFGAPPIDEVGVGFDPDFARAELEAAGYPNCEGFPRVTLMGYGGQNILNRMEFFQAQWAEHLGCDLDQILLEQQGFPELLAATSPETDDAEVPHLWTLGWGPDYPDENNWVGDVLWCERVGNRQKRTCNGIDDLIVEAREELDPARRIELYAQIEAMFFGPEGEFPFFPLSVSSAFEAVKPWYDYTPAAFGMDQWYNNSIDMEAKLAARG